ncbi:MAG TPA: deoxynucleoside kinase [Steroidobacteraceae bacterium]|nr:deoxynucleoside kinase [Steroidobacteraceae bacterium]
MSTPGEDTTAAAGAELARAPAPELPAQRYIVVEGPIGVGKTSLAKRLAETLEADLVLEQDAQNPFLERFYKNPKSGALPAQLFFLFQRAQQLGSLKQQDLFAARRVGDYLFEKDRLFAALTLDAAELSLYDQVASRLDVDPPRPDLVLYLQAPVETLLARIAKRGINYETGIDAAYLSRLNDAYARFFHDYDRAPLLIVNAANIDPTQNQADYDELVAAIRRMKKGRMYYNPMRHATI